MIRLIYNIVFPVGLLVFLPAYLLKMIRRGQYADKFGQRLGIYTADVRARLRARESVWLHAVSVGEVTVALKLASAMQLREPALKFVLTTTTTTGFALANKQAPDSVEVLYTPLDWWPIMRRAFDVIRPSKLVLVEAEVWPNQVAEASRRGIPIALVNARLSPRSETRFRRFAFLVAPLFRQLDLVCVQEEEDVARWAAVGAARIRIRHVGSIKFDVENVRVAPEQPRELLTAIGVAQDRPILLAGSTHPGEDRILAQVFVNLRGEFPDLFLIIAPRHVERARDVAAQAQEIGLRVRFRSDVAGVTDVDCLVLNTTGELRDWYAVATVVFIGKSLTVRGGQNPVEPIVAGCPVIFGPHMENFATLARSLVSHDAAVQVADATALGGAIAGLLRDEAARDRLVANARGVLGAHRGATMRTVDLLSALRSGRGHDLA
jgi:3-deoxy-D-manno-octulosonic-acid transferase